MKGSVLVALLAGAALFAVPSWAQPTGTTPSGPAAPKPAAAPPAANAARPAAPAPADPAKPPYVVAGFRSAKFGMTEAEVRAAIQADFAVKPDAIRSTPNAIERTTALVVSLPSLDPGPGPATAVFILGYQSKKLIQVNVQWAREASADKADAAPYLVAGVQLVNYFNQFVWRDGRVNLGIPIGPASLLLFGGEDDKTGAVQVVADGVSVERKAEGQLEAAPHAGSPVILRVSYIADRTKPDIFRLEPGRF
jgi:hypothetical protein